MNHESRITNKRKSPRSFLGFARRDLEDFRGFTLIELLVVIAIIGILSSVVMVSLTGPRQKARDAKRISDIKQIQLALELYNEANGEYPDTVATLLTGNFMSSEPKDPSTNVSYPYDNYTNSSGDDCATNGQVCRYYHLGAKLESANSALLEDRDVEIGSKTTGTAPDGVSDQAACGSSSVAVSADLCFDVTP